ncbi:MAG: hypothetical protein ACREM8_02300, partial [Vulcanimicrobiaceae bacterium]
LHAVGISSYYYTGDTGAPPNRTFVDGKMVSKSVWAYPIMPDREVASIDEMSLAGVTPTKMDVWLLQTIRYLRTEHTATLIYSHPYDLLVLPYAVAYERFVDEVQREIEDKRLQAMTMPQFTAFSQRFIETTFSFKRSTTGWNLIVQNPKGLAEITIAVPDWLRIASGRRPDSLRPAGTPPNYTFFAITKNVKRIDIPLIQRS